jgi:hypothetical protein
MSTVRASILSIKSSSVQGNNSVDNLINVPAPDMILDEDLVEEPVDKDF